MLKDKLQIILSRYKQIHPTDVDLLAVMKMDDLIDKWSILIAADWITSENHRQVFNDFVVLIKDELNEEERGTIARVGVFSTKDHLVSELLNYKTGTIITDTKVNGNKIYEGYIIKSGGLASRLTQF